MIFPSLQRIGVTATGENISLYGILNYPEQCSDSIKEYYGIMEDEDEENDK